MIIFINGSINTGKSTVAKILAKELPNPAIVEIDSLREMIEWMSIDEAVPLNLENAVSVIRNFSRRKFNIIVPYPISKDNYDYLTRNLKDLNIQIYIFTLAPSLEKITSNRGGREIGEKGKERIKHHYNIGIHNPDFGEIIDNTNQTPEETAKYILSKIRP